MFGQAIGQAVDKFVGDMAWMMLVPQINVSSFIPRKLTVSLELVVPSSVMTTLMSSSEFSITSPFGRAYRAGFSDVGNGGRLVYQVKQLATVVARLSRELSSDIVAFAANRQ